MNETNGNTYLVNTADLRIFSVDNTLCAVCYGVNALAAIEQFHQLSQAHTYAQDWYIVATDMPPAYIVDATIFITKYGGDLGHNALEEYLAFYGLL